jgi:hypothetical protein
MRGRVPAVFPFAFLLLLPTVCPEDLGDLTEDLRAAFEQI